MAKGAKDPEEVAAVPEPLLALVGARVRMLRKRAKLRQSKLAEAAGTSQSYIVSVEAGEQNMTLSLLARIAAALGVAPMMLLLEGEFALAADEGKLDQFKEVLRAAMQHTDQVAELLQRAHLMASSGVTQPAPASPEGMNENLS